MADTIGGDPAVPTVRQVGVDLRRNLLRLDLSLPDDVDVGPGRLVPAVVDIGEAGRLVGVEVLPDDPNGFYLALFAAVDRHIRSIAATVTLREDRDGRPIAVELARRGSGYEIAYPSGNQ